MKKLATILLTTIGFLPMAGFAKAENLKVLTSWDQSYAAVGQVLYPFLERLEKETTADLNITKFGPETVPPFEQLTPATQGLFDVLYTNGGYHFNDIAVGMSLDGLSGDIEQVHKSGIWDQADRAYQKIGLKLIAIFYDLNGYHIILKKPVGDDSLAGRRIRGTPLYHPTIEALGGSPVVLPGPEIYPSLERGVIDGAAWPTVGAAAFRWYEVSDYMMRPTFGQVSHLVLMNLDKWNSLDEKTRSEIEASAMKYEVEASELFNGLAAKEKETLEAEGMEITNLKDDVGANLKATWFGGVMKLAGTKSPEDVEAIKKMAIDADIDG